MSSFADYRYHFAALFTVAVWGATFVSTKVLIANGLTPAEIFLLRFALAYQGICLLSLRRGGAGPAAEGGASGAVGRRNGGLANGGPVDGGSANGGLEDGGPADGGLTIHGPTNGDRRKSGPVDSRRADGGRRKSGPGGRKRLFRPLRGLRAASWRDEGLLCAAGITGGSLYFLAENIALAYAPASNVSLIVCTAPVWTALAMSRFYRGERMSPRQRTGAAAAFAGMVLVVLNGRFVLHLAPAGDLLALAAALLWMLYSLTVKRLAGRYPSLFITRKVFFYGLLTILPWFAAEPFAVGRETLARPAVWGNLLFLGMVASMLCYLLWNAAMRRLGAVRTTNYIYINPLVTILTAALCIGERITPAALAGAALILWGMWHAERPAPKTATTSTCIKP